MKNLAEIKTTIIGGILFLVGLYFLIDQYQNSNDFTLSGYALPIVLLCGGIGFALAPDRILDLAFRWGNKKVDKE